VRVRAGLPLAAMLRVRWGPLALEIMSRAFVPGVSSR
jgi:hypothetical protein